MKLLRFLRALPLALMLMSAPAVATEQSSFVIPDTGPHTMADMVDTYFNPAFRAIAACSWGPSAPANGPGPAPIKYQCWADTTTNPVVMKIYDGASWVITGKLDATAHAWTPDYQGTDTGTASTATTGTSGHTLGFLDGPNTWSGVQSFNDGTLGLKGSSSGIGTIKAPAAASTFVWTMPAATDTLLAAAFAQIVTNKTINCANNTCTIRIASDVTGLGTGVATALGANVGSAGAPVLFNGAGGTPSSMTATNVTGLPANGGLTGQVPIANGGTAQSTAAGARASSGLNVDSFTGHGDSIYAILATDRTVGTNAAFTASRTWTLPAANAVNPGQEIIVADFQGTVTVTNTLVIARAGADTVNSGTSVTISAANGGYLFKSDGTSKWTAQALGSSAGGGVSSVNCGAGLSGGTVTTSGGCQALPQAVPGGRLALQMAAPLGGIPTVDVPAVTTKTIVLRPGTTTWTVPADWTSTNTIQTLGASGGSAGSSGGGSGGPSAGGAWAQIINQALTPGTIVGVNVPNGGTAGTAGGGAGGAAADTWLCNANSNCASIAGTAVIVGSKSGGNGTVGSGSTGGQAASSVGTTKFSGGNGAVGGSTGGGGAGGAAGSSGAGGNGVAGSGTTAGAGGTGNNGIIAGGSAAGGSQNASLSATDSVNFWLAEITSGGGGATTVANPAACAFGFGAGNSSGYGGGVAGGSNGGAGQAGCPGVIYITYTPAPAVLNYVSCATYVPHCAGPYVPFYNGTTAALGAFNAGGGGLSLTLNATDNTAGSCYEVFYFNNSGAPVIGTGPALTSCAAGSLARAASGGISLDPTGTVLSNTSSMTIKNNGSSFTCPVNQCSVLAMIHTLVAAQVPMQIRPNAVANGPNSELGLDNYFNQIAIRAKAQDATAQWIFSGPAANRAANNSTSNQITFLDGLGVKQLRYFYKANTTSSVATWAFGNAIAINQSCATGATHGAGQGVFDTQAAGANSSDGGIVITEDAPYPTAGLNKMQACDGAINVNITVFGNDFGQYGIDGPD